MQTNIAAFDASKDIMDPSTVYYSTKMAICWLAEVCANFGGCEFAHRLTQDQGMTNAFGAGRSIRVGVTKSSTTIAEPRSLPLISFRKTDTSTFL